MSAVDSMIVLKGYSWENVPSSSLMPQDWTQLRPVSLNFWLLQAHCTSMLQPEASLAFMRQLVYFEGNTNQQHILYIELLKRDRKGHTTQSSLLAVAMEVENRVAMVKKMVAFILVGFRAVAWIGFY